MIIRLFQVSESLVEYLGEDRRDQQHFQRVAAIFADLGAAYDLRLTQKELDRPIKKP